MRLAYLNQQGDKGALSLRRSEACLTVAELNAIGNKQLRENHPLNCAMAQSDGGTQTQPRFVTAFVNKALRSIHPSFPGWLARSNSPV